MPNHCYNEVKAKKEILDEIYDYKNNKITFNKLIPMPKELENSVADGSTRIKKAMYLYLNGDKDLLETKWEENKDVQEKYKTFEKMVEYLFEKYPSSDLDWFYEEEGMQFAGHCYSGENGEVLNEECEVGSYESEEDDMEF